jgi:plastocyanin
MTRVSHLIGGFFLLAAAVACGGGSDGTGLFGQGPANCSPDNTFCMTTTNFTPTSRTVGVNASVIWINDSGVTHNVTFDTPEAALEVAFGAGNIDAADKTSQHRKFAAAGSYAFHCTIHGTATSGMRGTVVVQ